ncbi:MAG: HNH endonuclease signature motif containing protein, partial [Intrasporangium sp.]|uniref:HNH endonuclease signature motif containing protein n=1 Tax=Intrasporangium sp. TaxID=1925024 RepID=UPI003F7EFB00
ESETRHRILAPLVGALARVVPMPAAPSPSPSGPAADSLEAAMDAELRVVEAVERAKAALDAQSLVALARMQSLAESMVAAAPAAARAVPVSPDELVTMEVATATGLSQGETAVRAELAAGPVERFGPLWELLAAGTVSLRRACQVVEETRHLQHDVVAELVESVFAPTRDGAGLSGNLFRQRLRRAILRADADAAAAAARRRAARRRNGARAQIFDDGTGELVVRNDADKIAAAIDRADAAARAAKAAGDPRSLDQLRADFITGAASYGQPCGTAGCGSMAGPVGRRPSGDADCGADGRDSAYGSDTADGADGADGAYGRDTADGADAADGTKPHSCRFVPDWYASFGHRPAAKVWIVVPITTALGLDEAPCQLPGHGWLAAEQARAIITAEGSIWQTMLADLDSGTALRLSHRGYRPTAAMVEHVIAVDGVCRGPGCTVPASRCDVDHDIAYPEGPTAVTNLTDKHRQHHRIRTAGFWRAVRDPHDARVTWRTSAGRRYVTYPADWLEDVRPRRKFGGHDHNPEPVTRPYGPEPNPDPSARWGADCPPEPPPF